MADPTPLVLSQTKSSDSDDSDPPPLLDQFLPSLESIIEKCIGDKFSLAQFLQAIVVSLAWYFDAQQAFISIFADAQPTWHGMLLALGDLSFNLYLSVTFNALSELLSSLVTFYIVGKMNRKSSLLLFSIISGIFNVMCVLKGRILTRLQIGLEIFSLFSACTADNILLIFTVELFPTCVRNSALSMVRQALVFGGVFSPVLAAAGLRNSFLSYGVFGVVIACLSLFAVCLPETRGRALCDTVDEEDQHKHKSEGFVMFKIYMT